MCQNGHMPTASSSITLSKSRRWELGEEAQRPCLDGHSPGDQNPQQHPQSKSSRSDACPPRQAVGTGAGCVLCSLALSLSSQTPALKQFTRLVVVGSLFLQSDIFHSVFFRQVHGVHLALGVSLLPKVNVYFPIVWSSCAMETSQIQGSSDPPTPALLWAQSQVFSRDSLTENAKTTPSEMFGEAGHSLLQWRGQDVWMSVLLQVPLEGEDGLFLLFLPVLLLVRGWN